MSQPSNFSERAAAISRYVLVASLAVIVTLIAVAPRQNPLSEKDAHAEGAISAAPDYLALTLAATAAEKFYLIDTNKQVICVYNVTGDKFRLVGARKFDVDVDIKDASVAVVGSKGQPLKAIEGGNGVSRVEAKEYLDGLNKFLEQAPK